MNTDTSILKNALITGGSGMVAAHIDFGYKPSSKEMNIININSINNYISKCTTGISCIIHLAAVNLRESEENHNKSIDVNINGTLNMLSVAIRLNIPFILLSTGAVFSSDNPNIKFTEDSIVRPNCIYGLTKSSSEKAALLYNKTILIRTGWLFGGHQKSHYKFVENVINNLSMNTKIKASNDFFGSPTYVVDLIQKMKELISNSNYGIHHIVNSDFGTGYDIAFEIAHILGKNTLLIESVSSREVPNPGPYRGKTEMLETLLLDNKLRNWRIALKEYINIYLKNLDFPAVATSIIQNKYWSNREKCRMCGSHSLCVFFHLEPTPPANHFLSIPAVQEKIPLDISICDSCKHIQLIQIVEPSYQYSNYFYVSSTSSLMVDHLQKNVEYFTEFLNLSKDDNILEIGANDGVCIKYLLEKGYNNIIGVDPAQNINKRHNLPIICDFFGKNMLERDYFKDKHNKYKLIYAFHCCAHIEDIDDVFNTVYKLLDNSGSFIMEVGYFYDVFKNNSFDTIYHEHIDYHTCKPIQIFSKKHNLILYNVRQNTIQGGSIQFFFTKDNMHIIDQSVENTLNNEKAIDLHNIDTLNRLKINVLRCGRDINYLLNAIYQNGKKIAGYGASAKSTTFLHQFKLDGKLFEFIIDDSIYKHNLYSTGLHIPIKSFDYLQIEKIDYILILSWNFTDIIIKKLEAYRKNGMRIIIPFPEIHII